jgi:GAF domain-containing protein
VPTESSPLTEGLKAMSGFFVGGATLHHTLEEVAHLSVDTVAGADMAGITMLVDGEPRTAVFTDPTAPEVDSAQYETGTGPCLDAFRHNQVYRVDDFANDRQWPLFSETAATHGLRSIMSLPLTVRHQCVGALNVYSRTPATFSDDEVYVALQFAAQAAILLANSQAYWDAHKLTENMATAMQSQATLEQAKGIVMATQSCNPSEALQRLVEAAERENRTVRDIAQEFVAASAAEQNAAPAPEDRADRASENH